MNVVDRYMDTLLYTDIWTQNTDIVRMNVTTYRYKKKKTERDVCRSVVWRVR